MLYLKIILLAFVRPNNYHLAPPDLYEIQRNSTQKNMTKNKVERKNERFEPYNYNYRFFV